MNEFDELIARQEIYQVLTRDCRGVDRCDVDQLRSVYHDDATDDHGIFKGAGIEFAQWVVDWEKANIKLSQHFIGNFTCDLQGDVAHTETYCISFGEDLAGNNATSITGTSTVSNAATANGASPIGWSCST